jgi:hypothetical protein
VDGWYLNKKQKKKVGEKSGKQTLNPRQVVDDGYLMWRIATKVWDIDPLCFLPRCVVKCALKCVVKYVMCVVKCVVKCV